MEIIQEKNGTKLVIKLVGSLNTITAEELEEVLKLALDGVDDLVFDFEKLEYLTSAGIRVITATASTMAEKGKMKIINAKANEIVYEILRITDLLDAFNVE